MLLECHVQDSKVQVAVLRRFRRIDPEPDNVRVVQEFGHLRYSYEMQTDLDGDVVLDAVELSSIFRLVIIVPDYHNIAARYSIEKRFVDIPDNRGQRWQARANGALVHGTTDEAHNTAHTGRCVPRGTHRCTAGKSDLP
eukprot:IDg1934t1